MDKTFAAIEKLKEVELELHRLKNALEMMNRANEAKKEWKGLSDTEKLYFVKHFANEPVWKLIEVIEEELRIKNT